MPKNLMGCKQVDDYNIIKVLEGKEKETVEERLFEEIIAGNFTNQRKVIDIQIQEV